MSDDKDLKEEGEEEKEGGVLSDSVLDAFDEELPVEDDLLKEELNLEEEEEPDVLDSGDYGTTDEW